MSTRSFTGGVTERGVLGRYVHFDGYPERRMPVLRAIVARDGAVAALRTILAAQWGGWSYLDPDRQENSLGEDRAEVVPGYGLRYRDTGPEEPLTLAEVIEDPFIEHAYVITPVGGVLHFDLMSDEGQASARAYADPGWREVLDIK